VRLSKSTVYRKRQKNRTVTAEKYDKVLENINSKIIVEWDGKQYTEEHVKVKRIAVLVAGAGVNRLLRVMPLSSGTADKVAEAVL